MFVQDWPNERPENNFVTKNSFVCFVLMMTAAVMDLALSCLAHICVHFSYRPLLLVSWLAGLGGGDK